MTFESFYRETFLPEHRHPANVAMHAIGVVGGLALVFWALISGPPWWALAWPVAHAAPGLIGHRLFDPLAQLGADIGVAIEHPADSLHRHARACRDIADIGTQVLAAHAGTIARLANSAAKALPSRKNTGG